MNLQFGLFAKSPHSFSPTFDEAVFYCEIKANIFDIFM